MKLYSTGVITTVVSNDEMEVITAVKECGGEKKIDSFEEHLAYSVENLLTRNILISFEKNDNIMVKLNHHKVDRDRLT